VPGEELDSEANRDRVLQFIRNGDLGQAQEHLWHSGGTQDWFATMAPKVEFAGDGLAQSDPAAGNLVLLNKRGICTKRTTPAPQAAARAWRCRWRAEEVIWPENLAAEELTRVKI